MDSVVVCLKAIACMMMCGGSMNCFSTHEGGPSNDSKYPIDDRNTASSRPTETNLLSLQAVGEPQVPWDTMLYRPVNLPGIRYLVTTVSRMLPLAHDSRTSLPALASKTFRPALVP